MMLARPLVGLLVAALVAVASLGARIALAQDLQPLPELKSPVTDTTGTLTPEQVRRLDEKLRAFEARKGTQIAVVLVPTTQPESIEQYSIRLAERAKVGRKKVDDGLIILVAMKDRTTRIEVGYGLEGAIPDNVASRVRREVMNPAFREGRYYDGLDAGAEAFMKLVDGEKLPPPRSAPDTRFDDAPDFQSLLVIGIVLVIVVGGILRAILGRFLGSAAVGGIAGTAAWFLTSLIPVAGIAGVLAFVFSLVFSGTFGRVGRGGRGGGWSNGGWSSGGWSTGGGWGSSGGGGWSGGGGTFGGGGSSGSWDN